MFSWNPVLFAVMIFAASCLDPARSAGSQHDQEIIPFSGQDVTNATNPHFTGKYCNECHDKVPGTGTGPLLKFNGDFNLLCRCHGYTSEKYIHPVDIVPSEEKKAVMPKDFPLRDGKITCSTCHDIYRQCQKNEEIVRIRPGEKKFHRAEVMFLRGDPAQTRTELCFKCHDEQKYRKLDPHDQVDDRGRIIAEKCLYCHTEKPDEKTASYDNVKLIGDLRVICQRCHGAYTRHPANVNHLRRPSDKLYERMRDLEVEFQVVLPLDSDGKMTCITCHNPHEGGVIPSEKKGAKGAGEEHRHRIPKILCVSCHAM